MSYYLHLLGQGQYKPAMSDDAHHKILRLGGVMVDNIVKISDALGQLSIIMNRSDCLDVWVTSRSQPKS